MTTQPAPGTPAWYAKITASKIAAILGISPYQSPRALWHLMRGDITPPAQTTDQARGHYLEPAILAWWRDQHPDHTDWQAHPTYRLGDWAAATPDAAALIDGHRVLVEAKSEHEDHRWGDPGTDQIPAHYLAQAYWQMHLSGATRTWFPILGPHLRFAEYVVDYDPEIGTLLEAKAREFYDSLTGDDPPPLDDTVATLEVMRRLHPDIDRGETAELDYDTAAGYTTAVATAKTQAAAERYWRSRLHEAMGVAQYAAHGGVTIARRQPNRVGVSLVTLAGPGDLPHPPEDPQ